MRKITSVLCFAAAMAAQSLMAKDGDVIKIAYNGTSATVTIPASASVSKTVSGAHVTLTAATASEEYVYEVSGTTDNGSLTINGDYKLTLRLNGANITNTKGAAIDVECGKRIAVELADGTNNELVDSKGGVQKAAMYFTGHPEFQGGGSLIVTGNTKHAISAKEYLELKKSTGTITILSAVGDGIHCGKGKVNNENNYFKMNGGTVNIISAGGDGIDSDDFGSMQINGGNINLMVNANDVSGLKCDSVFTMTGGTINAEVTGIESDVLRCNYKANLNGGEFLAGVSGNGSKGIKAKKSTDKTVNNGGYVNFAGANVNVIVCGGNSVIDGETSKCMGISVDADMALSAGYVKITTLGSEAYAYNVKGNETQTGGNIDVTTIPWNYTPYGYQYDMTAYVSLSIDGSKPADLGTYLIGAFVGDECRGIASIEEKDNYQWGEIRICSNSVEGEKVSFRILNGETSVECIASETITFKSMDTIGMPSSPMVLSVNIGEPVQLGDIDGDGQLTISDITALINLYLNYNEGDTIAPISDIDCDGKLTISDITELINLYLNN